jgi:hypothetical protein
MTRLETWEKRHFDPSLPVARLRTKKDFPEFESWAIVRLARA